MGTHIEYTMNRLTSLMNELKHTWHSNKVLELGCGSDTVIRTFLEKENRMIYLASDSYCKTNNRGIPLDKNIYYNNKMEDLKDFKDNEFDLVIICHAFEHCEDPITALREIHRVLKQDGYIITVTPSPCYHQILGSDIDHIFVLNEMQLSRLFKYVGFNVVKSFIDKEKIDREQDWNVFSVGKKMLPNILEYHTIQNIRSD